MSAKLGKVFFVLLVIINEATGLLEISIMLRFAYILLKPSEIVQVGMKLPILTHIDVSPCITAHDFMC